MPKLTRANATFHTNGPAKGPDSEIEIIVTDSAGTIVAQEQRLRPVPRRQQQGPVPDPGAQRGGEAPAAAGRQPHPQLAAGSARSRLEFQFQRGPDLR